MTYALYLSHPQVRIDPDVPIPNWGLSEEGAARAKLAAKSDWAKPIKRIYSSNEAKALQTAKYFAAVLNIPISAHEKMGENDRSSTGFLPPATFEAAADQFMNFPGESFKGWERAVDAQTRIIGEVNKRLDENEQSPVLFVGHGGVGTLLKCHLANVAIARSEDQPANGGGNIFAFDLETRQLLCDWTPIEEFTGVQ